MKGEVNESERHSISEPLLQVLLIFTSTLFHDSFEKVLTIGMRLSIYAYEWMFICCKDTWSSLWHQNFENPLAIPSNSKFNSSQVIENSEIFNDFPEEFADRPIPKYAEQLSGEALVDYVNRQQPFFEVSFQTMSIKKTLSFSHSPSFCSLS